MLATVSFYLSNRYAGEKNLNYATEVTLILLFIAITVSGAVLYGAYTLPQNTYSFAANAPGSTTPAPAASPSATPVATSPSKTTTSVTQSETTPKTTPKTPALAAVAPKTTQKTAAL